MAGLLYLMSPLNGDELNVIDNNGKYMYSSADQLHLTYANSFAMPDTSLPKFMLLLDYLTSWLTPIQIKSTSSELFGENFDIPVQKVKSIPDDSYLYYVNNSIEKLIFQCGGKINYSEYAPKWSPHVSWWNGIGIGKLNSLNLINHQDGFGVNVVTLKSYDFNN